MEGVLSIRERRRVELVGEGELAGETAGDDWVD